MKDIDEEPLQSLRAIRKSRGMKQKHLAKLLGCSVSEVSRLERGAAKLDAKQLGILRTHFGVSVDEVLGSSPLAQEAWAILTEKDAEIAAFKKRLAKWEEVGSSAFFVLKAHGALDIAKRIERLLVEAP